MPPYAVSSRRRNQRSLPVQGPYFPNLGNWQAQGLIGWWPLGDCGPVSLLDYSPSVAKNNLTVTGALGRKPTGFGGNGFSNTGSTANYLSVASLLATRPYTLLIWFNAASASTSYDIFWSGASASDSNYEGIILSDSGQSGRVGALSGNGVETASYSSGTFSANTPNHAVGIFTSTASRTGGLNGLLGTTDATSRTPTGLNQTSVGALKCTSVFGPINGWVWDARLYNYAMTATQVAELYANWRDLYWQPQRVYSFQAAGGATNYTQSLAGTVTPSAALAKATAKPLTGTETPSGAAVVKAVGQHLSATETPSAALAKAAGQHLADTVTPSGAAVVKAVAKTLAATETPAATLAKAAGKGLADTATPSAALAKAVGKGLSGAVALSATCAKAAALAGLVGAVAATALLTKAVARSASASAAVAGSFSAHAGRGITLTGAVSVAGSLVRAIGKGLSGALALTGLFTKVGPPPGTVTSPGPVLRRRPAPNVLRRPRAADLVVRPLPRARVVRTVRVMPTSPEFPTVTVVKGVTEAIEFVLDFRTFDEAVAQNLSSVSVPAVSGVTTAGAAVLAAATLGVPIGKGAVVTVSGGAVNTDYTVSCYGTFSGGAVREIRLKVCVR